MAQAEGGTRTLFTTSKNVGGVTFPQYFLSRHALINCWLVKQTPRCGVSSSMTKW